MGVITFKALKGFCWFMYLLTRVPLDPDSSIYSPFKLRVVFWIYSRGVLPNLVISGMGYIAHINCWRPYPQQRQKNHLLGKNVIKLIKSKGKVKENISWCDVCLGKLCFIISKVFSNLNYSITLLCSFLFISKKILIFHKGKNLITFDILESHLSPVQTSCVVQRVNPALSRTGALKQGKEGWVLLETPTPSPAPCTALLLGSAGLGWSCQYLSLPILCRFNKI